jgi:hypothetical protein
LTQPQNVNKLSGKGKNNRTEDTDMVPNAFISLVNRLFHWTKEELHRLWKKYADDFIKGFQQGYPTKVDSDGREIMTYFETLRAPDSSDEKH